jgi:hypothetical protein
LEHRFKDAPARSPLGDKSALPMSHKRETSMKKKLVLETTAPFQGLAELVAYDEGLFEKEGLTIEWADREKGVDKTPQLHITNDNHNEAPRFASHGRLLEEGKADLYNACEWGNYSRVESSKVGSRQVGRRSIVTYAALVVRPDSPVQTAQQFANRLIGVPFFFGTHYLTLQMLEGFVPRDQIKLGRVPNGSPYRFNLLMTGQIEATTLTEPYISLAEKKGCRMVVAASITAPRWPPTASMRRPTAPSIGRCARRCAASMPTSAPTCTTSSTTTKPRTPRSPSSPSTTCARAASSWSIRRRSRPTSCSAPTIG